MLRAHALIGDLASAVAAGSMPTVFQVLVEVLAEVNVAERRTLEALAEIGMRYIRAAEVLGAGADIGKPFPALPESLVLADESADAPKAWGHLGGTIRQSISVPSGMRTRAHDVRGGPRRVARLWMCTVEELKDEGRSA